MRKIIFLLLTFGLFCSFGQAFAYQSTESTMTGREVERNFYFIKKFVDTNGYDEEFRHTVVDVVIKIAVTNQSDSANWPKAVTEMLAGQAGISGWTRVDYRCFLMKRISRAEFEGDNEEVAVLRPLIRDLERISGNNYLSDSFIEGYIDKTTTHPSLALLFFSLSNSVDSDYLDQKIKILDSCRPSNNYIGVDANIKIFDHKGVETHYSFGGEKKRLPYKKDLKKYFKSFFQRAMTRISNDGIVLPQIDEDLNKRYWKDTPRSGNGHR